jgi:hypothetical protein
MGSPLLQAANRCNWRQRPDPQAQASTPENLDDFLLPLADLDMVEQVRGSSRR